MIHRKMSTHLNNLCPSIIDSKQEVRSNRLDFNKTGFLKIYCSSSNIYLLYCNMNTVEISMTYLIEQTLVLFLFGVWSGQKTRLNFPPLIRGEQCLVQLCVFYSPISCCLVLMDALRNSELSVTRIAFLLCSPYFILLNPLILHVPCTLSLSSAYLPHVALRVFLG